MTDAIDFDELNLKVITEFRENGGTAPNLIAAFRESGATVDDSAQEGAAQDMPLVLVHHFGAKSGIERIAPLVPYVDGDRIFIFASKGGSPENPAWYHNLVANPKTTIEYGAETFPVLARVLTGTERDEIYAQQVALQPQFGEYQRNTDRLIPVVELQRLDR
ncbi:nitroreductase family deazaflavin-dependent oxidoreductase [Nocardia alni]|uniref:nitroreductase family deazaflavin-dependent oxidoreductase n=1 Tax=Nocardia alni TaxID=2815723 RepID=UPI001C248D2A|nr:nitroreductase family deazaflavin-dependent oxidoreductase [Nocardia alni]